MTKKFLCYLAVTVAILASTPRAKAQAVFSFSGGSGAPLTVTLSQSVSYTATNSASNGTAPIFIFVGLGAYFNSYYTLNGSITYEINGGGRLTLTELRSGYAANSISATDAYLFNSLPGLSLGDVVTLDAGTSLTTASYTGTVPPSGSYTTFITNTSSNRYSANGVAVVPEPSTWALLGAAVVGLGLALRRRSCAQLAT